MFYCFVNWKLFLKHEAEEAVCWTVFFKLLLYYVFPQLEILTEFITVINQKRNFFSIPWP